MVDVFDKEVNQLSANGRFEVIKLPTSDPAVRASLVLNQSTGRFVIHDSRLAEHKKDDPFIQTTFVGSQQHMEGRWVKDLGLMHTSAPRVIAWEDFDRAMLKDIAIRTGWKEGGQIQEKNRTRISVPPTAWNKLQDNLNALVPGRRKNLKIEAARDRQIERDKQPYSGGFTNQPPLSVQPNGRGFNLRLW